MHKLIKAAAIGCVSIFLLLISACSGGSSGNTSAPQANTTAPGTPPPPADPTPTPRPATGPCHSLSVETCAIPFPSNEFTVKDDTNHTGLALSFKQTQVDGNLLDQLPENLTLENIFADSDGFSAATPVIFEFQQALSPASLKASDSPAIVAINLATGDLHPISASVSQYALSKKHTKPSHIIEVFPRSRWEFGATYVVAVTKSLKNSSGQPLSNTAQMNLKAIEYAQQNKVLESLNGAGINNEQLLSLTVFTVRSEENVTRPLKTASAWNFNQKHPVRNLSVQYFSKNDKGNIAALVHGEVLSYDFRRKDRSIDYSTENARQRESWLKFQLTLPKAANTKKVPVAIYGHGIAIIKETSFFTVGLENAKHGIATLSIDQPYHGTRIQADGGYILDKVKPKDLNFPVSMFFQGAIDFGSLHDALIHELYNIDVLPLPEKAFTFPIPIQVDHSNWTMATNTEKPSKGDAIPELDMDRVFYQGTSLGGVLNSSYLALSPYEIRGAVLQVAGVGVMRILSESVLWTHWFYQLIPEGANGAQAILLRSAATHLLDTADAINFAHYFRHPPTADIPKKKLAVIASINDLIVPNSSTIALAEIAELPLAGKELFPLPGVPRVNDWQDGSGIKQVNMGISIGINDIDGAIAHGGFFTPDSIKFMNEWIQAYVFDE